MRLLSNLNEIKIQAPAVLFKSIKQKRRQDFNNKIFDFTENEIMSKSLLKSPWFITKMRTLLLMNVLGLRTLLKLNTPGVRALLIQNIHGARTMLIAHTEIRGVRTLLIQNIHTVLGVRTMLIRNIPAWSENSGSAILNIPVWSENSAYTQGWAKLVLIALERYSVALKGLTFNLR
jgi:hypothetical protein